MSDVLRVERSGPLRGRIRLPGDLHLSLEAILWAALADSPSLLVGLSESADCAALIAALRALGVPIAQTPAGLRVAGVGLSGLKLPQGALHARASSEVLELLTALLSGQEFGTRIEAEGRALSHSLRTVVEPLRARGAHVKGKTTDEGDVRGPIAAAPRLPGELLSEVEIAIPTGDPSTKRALLISGLFARGISAISETFLSRDHTERALVALGVPVETLGGMTLLDTSEGAPHWSGFEWTMPGDATLFAYLSALVLAVPGSDVSFENVLVNRSRSAWLEVLTQAGAFVELTPKGDLAGNEPVADVRVRAGKLRSVRLGGEQVSRLLEELPALLLLGPALTGRLTLRDVPPQASGPRSALRFGAQIARGFGADCTDYEDGFDLSHATLEAQRLAQTEEPALQLLGLGLGLCAEGETVLHAPAALDALYPELTERLAELGASVLRDKESA